MQIRDVPQLPGQSVRKKEKLICLWWEFDMIKFWNCQTTKNNDNEWILSVDG